HDRPLQQSIVRRRIDAMDRVDDDRHAQETADHPTIETRLRIVCVEDVRANSTEGLSELPSRSKIRDEAHTPSGGLERYVLDPSSLQILDPRPRGRDADRPDPQRKR